MPYADLTPKDVERFWSKVDTSAGPDGCWPWTAAKVKFGYGYFSVRRGGRTRTWRAHRVAYEQAYETDPGDMVVLHGCDNPWCCNPKHLSLGTHQDNENDKVSKGRQAKGERYSSSKLTEEMVREIRRAREAGESGPSLAKRYVRTASRNRRSSGSRPEGIAGMDTFLELISVRSCRLQAAPP